MKRFFTLFFTYFFLISIAHSQETSLDINPNQKAIKALLDAVEVGKTYDISGKKIYGSSYLTSVYKNNNYSLLWTSSKNIKDLIIILEASYYEGLHPKDYHIDYIKANSSEISNNSDPQKKAKFDIIFTSAILTYAGHLIQGKVHPTSLDPSWNYNPRLIPDTAEFLVLDHLEKESLIEGVNSIKTKMPMYAKLKQWFVKYDSILKAGGDIKQIEYPNKALRLGDTSEVVTSLKIHLNNYGISVDNTNEVFDEELDKALKEFQLHNGLEDDGIAGKKTYAALNLSLEDKIDKIRVNLERCRWINNEIPADYLLVNIADFNLYLWRNHKMVYKSRVVVGKEKHETPVFTSNIKYLVFNPTWTVPYSIATKETLPRLKKDPSYLSKHNMTLLRGGTVVDPSTINFNEYSTRKFPFTVRQEPGSNNALGQVKFIFPNKYSVYLHDTPSKGYFNRSERTFSHGCIRVQNPLLLAEQLLEDKGYDQKKINEVLDTKKLTNVNLSKPLPVMLMYWTCYENEVNKQLYFFSDVYKRDEKLLSELNKGQ